MLRLRVWKRNRRQCPGGGSRPLRYRLCPLDTIRKRETIWDQSSRPDRSRRCRHPSPTTLLAPGKSCVLRSFQWIMLAAPPQKPLVSAPLACICSCQPSSHCNGHTLRGLQDGCRAAGDPQIGTLSILHSGLNLWHVILHILRWQSEATRLCCQRHLRLARSTAARTIFGSSAASTSVGHDISTVAAARRQCWPRWPTQASSLIASSAICVLRVRSRRLSCSSCFAAETEILDRRALVWMC